MDFSEPMKHMLNQMNNISKQIKENLLHAIKMNSIFSTVLIKQRLYIFEKACDYIEKNIPLDKRLDLIFEIDDTLMNKNEKETVCNNLSFLYDKQKNVFIIRIYDKNMSTKSSNVYENENDVELFYDEVD